MRLSTFKVVLVFTFSMLVLFTPTSHGQALPSSWLDQDIGSVGLAGSATYANGTFTVKGAGTSLWGTADGFHIAYRSLSGDGSIVARITSLTYGHTAGVIIRETLDPGAMSAFDAPYSISTYLNYRLTTGGTTSQSSLGNMTLPTWVKLTRSANTFSAYASSDGVNWTQVGTSQTINMAPNVYIGLGVSSGTTSVLATATFDSVSISTTATPAPVISGVSPTSGPVGTQVVISGSGFGSTQSGSTVMFNGASTTASAWSATSITIGIPTGATSGLLSVLVAPSMNSSNAVNFYVTPPPPLTGWLNLDIGQTGVAGTTTYSNGTFTVKGAGAGGAFLDAFQYAYQFLSGDGTIVARVVSTQNTSYAGVMIRETLNPASTCFMDDYQPFYTSSSIFFRTATGGSNNSLGGVSGPLPYWVKVVRSGNTFTGYSSPDGVNWIQTAAAQTINMVQNVQVGLAVSSGSTSTLATAAFDSVSISSSANPAPVIGGVSATTGSIGSQVVITGLGFASTQGGSLVTLNNVPVTINSWSATSIRITIPIGATSGPLLVSVAPSMNNSNPVNFTVTIQPLPSSWLNQDVGAVGVTGSATYSNGTFTVKGAGAGGALLDAFQYVYQPLSGDGTIVARVVTAQNVQNTSYAGVMIRETLNPASTCFMAEYQPFYTSSSIFFRTATGGTNNSLGGASGSLPYWVKVVRSGNTFTGYSSPDGVNWVQTGTTQTITMVQNVQVGLAVSSGSISTLATATFDSVSISSSSNPAPVISNVSATTGSIGSQVVVSGLGFGATQGTSVVTLNDAPVTINSWGATSITTTIPTGATSGPLLVSVAPTMNNSNPVNFMVTTQPLPSSWLNQDVGAVGLAGSATYSSGTFTVKGAGAGGALLDAFQFVYQPLSGDGTIVARVVSALNTSYAGVMVRETLTPTSTFFMSYYSPAAPTSIISFFRTATGGLNNNVGGVSATLPYWVKVVRNGNTFTAFASSDGLNWIQTGTTQTINMAQNVQVGLAVSSGSTSTLATATFDSVSITLGTTPFVTGLSPNFGGTGTAVTISGSGFGATQGTSTVTFSSVLAASVTSWGSTQIVATVPSAAPRGTGPVTVTVNSIASLSNVAFTVVRPVINTLTPPSAQPGGLVTLDGIGFGTNGWLQDTVQFNGVAASINSWTDTRIQVTVPSTATTGSVTVTVSGVLSNSLAFTVSGPLSVTSVSPNAGPVGAVVTITGTGFGATQSNSTASFYGGQATINTWSDTQVVAVVPSGAVTGPVSVQVAGNSVQGPTFTLNTTVQLRDSLGNVSSYTSVLVGGQWVAANTQGSGCSSCTQRGTIQYTYDNQGHVLSRTDELGRTTSYTYDSSGNMLSVTPPGAFGTTRYTYNNFGQVLTVTDPLGNVTTNAYDANGNLLSVTSPAPGTGIPASVTQFAYDVKGQMTQITDPLGNITRLTYTPAGLIATITDAQQNVTTYAYDAHGNRTSVTDALLKQTTFAYDAGDRLTTITYPGPTTTTFTYDSRGRRSTVTDQNGKITTYTYDDADRLTTVKDAANNVTTYAYDTESNLTSITDASNHTTTFTYDAFGRVTKTTFPSLLIETYAYDAVGNLASKTDRKNQYLTYTYDQLNRLTQKTYPDASSVNYTYDNNSRLTQVTDPTGTYQFTFDNMGRLTGTTTNYSFLAGRTFTNAYSYDAASNRTGFTDPEAGSTTYVYDTLNRLQTLTPPSAFSTAGFGFTYDALSRRTQMTRPNGLKSVYAYDNLSRLLSVLHQNGATTVDGAVYTVDNAGNRTSKADQLAGVTSNFAYDPLYQLTGVTQGANTTESYTYDPVGNRLSSLGVTPYSYNPSNQLTSTPTATYTYDNNGNTLTKVVGTNTTTYAWDFENRLASVTLPGTGGTVSFAYDPFGRRIKKVSSAGTSIYAYDGDNLIEEANAAGTVVARYEQTQNVDEPLAMLRSAATSYYDADGLGSVTALSSAAGSIANTYTYDSFGKLTASTGTLTNPFRYTAREFDSETGLYFYRARYYDASAGRFTSEDPIRFRGGFDFYAYVMNDPIDSIDPMGLCGPCDNIPPHPQDASVDDNMLASQQNDYRWWYLMVSRWNGPWDYKNYHGQPHPEYDNFGNFNYGATACAIGLPLNLALRAAGYAKSRRMPSDPYGSPFGRYPYGNQPDKQQQITNGYEFCKKCTLLSNKK